MDAFVWLEPVFSFQAAANAQSGVGYLIYEHLVFQADKRYGSAAATSTDDGHGVYHVVACTDPLPGATSKLHRTIMDEDNAKQSLALALTILIYGFAALWSSWPRSTLVDGVGSFKFETDFFGHWTKNLSGEDTLRDFGQYFINLGWVKLPSRPRKNLVRPRSTPCW